HYAPVVFFKHVPPPEIYALSLHDALPIFQEEHRPGADRAQLIHDLLRGVEAVVPALDDHVLLRLDVQTSTDDVLRKRLVIGHGQDRKSTRLNSSHDQISYAAFCLKKKSKC